MSVWSSGTSVVYAILVFTVYLLYNMMYGHFNMSVMSVWNMYKNRDLYDTCITRI